ncbi:MAG: TonB-dependent receptor [Colwellia sp.]|nr:TonB-dependent receptor [Colwellia sp.]
MSLKRVNLIKKNTAMRYISFSTIALVGVMNNVSAAETADNKLKNKSEIEVIAVKGIRGSLTQALNNKRFSGSVIDTISAEDIGDFPDKNIGDALQRIPGVTVSRGFGEVDGVTIRGTAPEHSILLLNGQNVASAGWFDLAGIPRNFNFEMVSAEQVAGLEVYKSVEAQNNEGGMGGTVNLKTRKPLDLDANTFFGSVESSYNSLADDAQPSISGLYSWKNTNENFGILLAHSVEKMDVVRETLRTFGASEERTWISDNNGNPQSTPVGFSSIVFEEERERTSSQATLQYVATDNLSFALDYNDFHIKQPHRNTALFAFLHRGGVIEADSIVYNDQGAVSSARVTPASQDGFEVPFFNNTVLRSPDIKTDIINITMDYESDNWSLHTVIGQSKSKSRTMQTSTWWGNHSDKNNTSYTFDLSGPVEFHLDNPDYPNDHKAMELYNEFTYLEIKYDNDISYYQADLSYILDKGIFTTIDVGLKYQEQTFSARIDWNNVNIENAMAEGLTLDDFNDGHISGLHGEHARGGSLTGFAVADADKLWDYGQKNQGALYIKTDFSIEEKITAAYIKGNFSGEGFRGNVGLRLVDTDVLGKGMNGENNPNDYLTDKSSYTNILPSINLVGELSDNLLFRFAAGSTVSRPNYDAMKMAAIKSASMGTATIGSPDIKPYKSDQYDIGLEWYFNDSSLVSGTIFQKNINDYIEKSVATENLEGCSTTCQVTRYRNVGSAVVSGFELQYQQDFGNGFGVQANYTYTDSELTNSAGIKVQMHGVSQNSYNLAGYYENDMFSARIAYNARDEWMVSSEEPWALAEAYDQVDASVVWHATDNIDLSFEVVNMFNEALVQNDTAAKQPHIIDEYGTRYFVSASVKF